MIGISTRFRRLLAVGTCVATVAATLAPPAAFAPCRRPTGCWNSHPSTSSIDPRSSRFNGRQRVPWPKRPFSIGRPCGTAALHSFLPHVVLEQGDPCGGGGAAAADYVDFVIRPGGWQTLVERKLIFVELEQDFIFVMCTVIMLVLLLGPAVAASGVNTATADAPNNADTTATYDPPVVGSAKWPIAAGCFGFALYSGISCLQPFHQTEQFRVHGNGSWTLERHLLGWNRKGEGSRLAKIRRVETGRVNRNDSFLLITDQNAALQQRRFANFLPMTEQDALATYIHQFILKLETIEAGDSPAVKAIHSSCPTE